MSPFPHSIQISNKLIQNPFQLFFYKNVVFNGQEVRMDKRSQGTLTLSLTISDIF